MMIMYFADYTCFIFSVASSVIDITATPNNPNTPSTEQDFTFTCTMHPESTADKCEVMLTGGKMNLKGMSVVVNVV